MHFDPQHSSSGSLGNFPAPVAPRRKRAWLDRSRSSEDAIFFNRGSASAWRPLAPKRKRTIVGREICVHRAVDFSSETHSPPRNSHLRDTLLIAQRKVKSFGFFELSQPLINLRRVFSPLFRFFFIRDTCLRTATDILPRVRNRQ
jgi:hypothetical protein